MALHIGRSGAQAVVPETLTIMGMTLHTGRARAAIPKPLTTTGMTVTGSAGTCDQIRPWAMTASATLVKPAILAPIT